MLSLSHPHGVARVSGPRAGAGARRIASVAAAVWLCASLLSGCSLLEKLPAEAPPEASPSAPPAPTPRAEPQPRAETRKAAPRPKRPQAQPVVVVYVGDVPVYRAIADAIVARLPQRALPMRLATDPAQFPDRSLTADRPVVAIGAAAARRARQHSIKPMVFCQVFNFRDYGLDTDGVVGISMVPPPAQQFQASMSMAPKLQRIGVLAGPGHDALIEAARADASAHGAELLFREVHSDKEALYEFKRMVPDADGFWLLPDERILSHGVLREIMAYSAKHEKLVLSFTPELLRFGAFMSASSDPADVADQVLAALQRLTDSPNAPFTLLPLQKAHIEVNPALAQSPQDDARRSSPTGDEPYAR